MEFFRVGYAGRSLSPGRTGPGGCIPQGPICCGPQSTPILRPFHPRGCRSLRCWRRRCGCRPQTPRSRWGTARAPWWCFCANVRSVRGAEAPSSTSRSRASAWRWCRAGRQTAVSCDCRRCDRGEQAVIRDSRESREPTSGCAQSYPWRGCSLCHGSNHMRPTSEASPRPWLPNERIERLIKI